ncbi:MAG: HAMP domain-containing protein [Calditrichaeota bacterium]|nr:HAMP domain-containing protein [Calditrichota bacterium]HQU72184.1 methyl-accepting chemotaxis protein [Calditrichia bacterium]
MSIKYKILIPILAILILLSGTQLWIVSNDMESSFQSALSDHFSDKGAVLLSNQHFFEQKALENAALFQEDPAVLEAYRHAYQGNPDVPDDPTVTAARGELRNSLAHALSGFKRVSGDPFKLHFHFPSGRSFLRVWRKTQQLSGTDLSDDISSFRQTVLDVNRGKASSISGIEIGRGGFAIRGLLPIDDPDNGRHLGSVEMLFDFGLATESSKKNETEDFVVLMNRDLLSIAKSLDDPGKHPVLSGNQVLVSATVENYQQHLTPAILALTAAHDDRVYLDGNYGYHATSIKDYNGKNIGSVLFIKNCSAELAAISDSRLRMAWVIVLASLAASAIVILLISMITRSLGKLRRLSGQLADGNTDVEIDIHQNDEIGELANAFRDMLMRQRNKVRCAQAIAGGNLDAACEIASGEDALGKAMEEMRTNLKEGTSKLNEALDQANLQVQYLNSIPLPIQAIDLEYNMVYCNQAMAELLGKPAEELIGTKCYSQLRNPHCQTENCAIGQCMKSRTTTDAETILEKSKTPIRYSGSPLFNSEGKIIGAVEAAMDLSQVKSILRTLNSAAGQIVRGNLGARADLAGAKGDYRELLESFNRCIDDLMKPVNEAIVCLDSLAEGDLTQRMQGNYQGDLARMKKSYNHSLENLHQILNGVMQSIDQLGKGSQQVSSTSQTISEGAVRQAGALQETTASMSDLESKANQNSGIADSADQLAGDTAKSALTQRQQMAEMMEAMQEIDHFTVEIIKIVKVIDEIAFQTNLLSLNAAVEAARAGVHGKGFAVVAEEVRSLAMHSSNAAKETTTLIDNMVQKIKKGLKSANMTSQGFKNVIENVQTISEMMNGISESTRKQLDDFAMISQALIEVDKVTQANAASSEESASAAEELAGQAMMLQQSISQLRFEQNARSVPAASGPGKNGNREAVISLGDADFETF